MGGLSLTTSPGAAHLSPIRGGPGSLRPPAGPGRSPNLGSSLSLGGRLGCMLGGRLGGRLGCMLGGMLGGRLGGRLGGMLWGPVITLAKSVCCRGIGGGS